MKSFLVLAILILFGAQSSDRKCSCQAALESDQPHGANELIEYSAKTVKRIQGTVLDPNGAPINEAVVEVYKYSGGEKIFGSKERQAACLMDRNGSFCFTGLPSGRYLLRIGTRKPEGFNEVFVKVKLDLAWWTSWLRLSKKLEVKLSLGT
jgi:hypothetical protein